MTWRSHAACKDAPTEVFFNSEPTKSNYRSITQHARAFFCNECPVSQECLDYAADHNITLGVYGGVGPHSRANYRADRISGRHQQQASS